MNPNRRQFSAALAAVVLPAVALAAPAPQARGQRVYVLSLRRINGPFYGDWPFSTVEKAIAFYDAGHHRDHNIQGIVVSYTVDFPDERGGIVWDSLTVTIRHEPTPPAG